MPALSEVPFNMRGLEAAIPPGTPPLVAKALIPLYEVMVQRADDIVSTFLMDPGAIVPELELSAEEIDVLRTGMIAGATSLLELFSDRMLLDGPKLAAYFTELAQ